MKKANLLILLLIALIGLLGVVIYQQNLPAPQNTQVGTPPAEQSPIKKPIIHYPVPTPTIPEVPAAETVPEKKPQVSPEPPNAPREKEEPLEVVLKQLFPEPEFSTLLIPDSLIQRFVVMVDNLPEKRLPRANLPIKAPGGRFIVSGTDEAPQTSSRNHKRYQPYVALLEKIKPGLAIKFYTRFYPVFQRAYEQLGYKNAYFNDRLIFTLDHLLETPEPQEPILLAQPSVLYVYADPLLENRSSGQKILIRIGPENRIRVFRVLAEYRRLLSNLHP